MLADGDGVADIDPAADGDHGVGIEAAVGTHGELPAAVAKPFHAGMGGAASGVGPALAQPGHQHVAGAGGDGQQRVIAPLAGIAVVACALLGQRRAWWSPGQWSGARRRVPPRPAKPGPATRGSPGRVDGRCPTVPPRVLAVPPVRNTSAASMQSPPASADATSVIILSLVFARPGASPRSRHCRTSSGRPRCRARVAGRSSPALHQAAVVEGDLDPVGVVAWQHLLGAPFPGSVFCYKTIIPEAQEHLLAASGR